MTTRREIVSLLEESNYDGLIEVGKKKHNIVSILISFTYDKEKIVCWRAIEAIGLVVAEIARTDPAEARNLAQRILWMMREESGNNAWSAPEMLGEIVRNSPGEFADFAPIIVSFHDEEMFRRGVMRAVFRIAEKSPGLVRSLAVPIVEQYLKDADAVVRGYAVLISGRLRLKELRPAVALLCQDPCEITICLDGGFSTKKVSKIAEETVILLDAEDE